MLRGEKVGLRPLETEDEWMLYGWLNNRSVLDDLGRHEGFFCTSLEDVRRSIASMLSSSNDKHFIIVDLKEGKGLGTISLNRIDGRNATADVMLMIGEKEAWSHGQVDEAVKMLLSYAFDQRNLHSLVAKVPEYNEKLIDRYLSCGFQKNGVVRHDHFHKGTYRNSLLLCALKEESTC